MTKAGNEVRSVHWAVKLLLTTLVGGLLAIGVGFIPADALAVVPSYVAWTLYIIILVIVTTICATVLYLRERNGWRRSLLMGMVVGVIASVAVTLLLGGVVAIFEGLVS